MWHILSAVFIITANLKNIVPMLIPTISIIFIVTFALVSRQWSQMNQYVVHVLAVSCILLTVAIAFGVHILVASGVQDMVSSMPEVWAALDGQHALQQIVINRYRAECSRKVMWQMLVAVLLELDVLRMTTVFWWTRLVFLLPPVMIGVVSVTSPLVILQIQVVVMYTVCSLYALFTSVWQTSLNYREFRLEWALKQHLAAEAERMRRVKELEVGQRDASLRADSIVLHTLKNIMADVSGCIELFTQDCLHHHLTEAKDCLDEGKVWCKKRQAMLQLAMGRYVANPVPVQLYEFGRDLVRRRAVSCNFEQAVVRLDPTLCNMVLCNVLNNAFRHGHPTDPQVAFTIRVERQRCIPGRRRVIFAITNRAHPAKPRVTEEFVQDVIAGKYINQLAPEETLSDHIGLDHIFTAADAHQMVASLTQVDDVVCFMATLEVEAEDDAVMPISNPCSPSQRVDLSVLEGQKILCIDDSPIARQLLLNGLPARTGALVEVFGETRHEVEEFLEEAVAAADIVVLDQHLDFGGPTVLGTDLVRRLRAEQFLGLICIRSADADGEDVEQYLAAGAHCVVGKDASILELAQQLATAHLQRSCSFVSGRHRSPRANASPAHSRGAFDLIAHVFSSGSLSSRAIHPRDPDSP
eukprot:EG_transcript_6555